MTCKYCSHIVIAKGLCAAHYQRMRAGVPLEPPLRAWKHYACCIVCGKKHFGLGLCNRHYKLIRWLATKKVLVASLGNQCADCHKTFPLNVYEFHHRDSKSKLFAISEHMHKTVSELQKEVDKCDLLCSNCHRMRHISKAEWTELIKLTSIFKRRMAQR
jgi:hypothetical protein